MIFGPWAKTEFYAQGGFSFHSNDARGATQTVEPISPDNPFPTACATISPLAQTKGGEIGVRTSAVPHLQSTIALWYLRSNSELQQDGDTGGTVASEQSSNRYGVEWANFYAPVEHLAFDFDIADSRAQFTQIDPADAAFINPTAANGLSYPQQLPGGKLVPEAVKVVISSGVTLHDYKGFSASLRTALLWSAGIDVGWNQSLQCNIPGQCRARLSIQQELGPFGRNIEFIQQQS